MKLPKFIESVLLRPQRLSEQIKILRTLHPNFTEVADTAVMTLRSSSANDYLEKVGVESIGFKHLDYKLGADGVTLTDPKIKVEVKSTKVKGMAVINDDTPMKLIKSDTEIRHLLFINASKTGDMINWALLAPYSGWTEERYKKIAKNLGLEKGAADWKWAIDCLPKDSSERRKCLEDLVKKHIPNRYVRGNPLPFKVIEKMDDSQLQFWRNPNYKGMLPAVISARFQKKRV